VSFKRRGNEERFNYWGKWGEMGVKCCVGMRASFLLRYSWWPTKLSSSKFLSFSFYKSKTHLNEGSVNFWVSISYGKSFCWSQNQPILFNSHGWHRFRCTINSERKRKGIFCPRPICPRDCIWWFQPPVPFEGILTHSMMQSFNASASSNVEVRLSLWDVERKKEVQPPSLLSIRKGQAK